MSQRWSRHRGQTVVSRGENVAPVFEGWEQNDDGTYNFVFGYMNRNWDEAVDVPIGPNNTIEPGGPDRGQPTHFLPRRNRVVFHIQVPKDWGNKDIVWTLTSRGKTERAYASLLPVQMINDQVISMNTSGSGYVPNNKPPSAQIDGQSQRTIRLGESLSLTAVVADDGLPKARPAPGPGPNGQNQPPGRFSALGLRVAWLQYRGPFDGAQGRPGVVTFDPPQFKVYQNPRGGSPWAEGWSAPAIPPDGRVPVKASFSAPGTYVVRVLAHDGYLSTARDVTVTVNAER